MTKPITSNSERKKSPAKMKKPDITVFATGLLGELSLKHLLHTDCRPFVVTNPPNSLRKRQTGNMQSFSDIFNIIESDAPDFASSANLNLPHTDIAFCIDWVKDFFHNCNPSFAVYHNHLSLLPYYRGYGAISGQFLRGVRVSGVTVYEDNFKIDAGEILYQQKIPILYEDTPITFIEKASLIIADFLLRISNGEQFEAIAQDESKAFYLTRTRGRQRLIDFNADASSVYNFIRAYSEPFSGATFYHNKAEYKALKSAIEKWHGDYGIPGTVIDSGINGVEVACGDGTILLKDRYSKIEIDDILNN